MPLVEIPTRFVCPLTKELIVDPATIEDDQSGQLYERKAIQEHFENNANIPGTSIISKNRNIKICYPALEEIRVIRQEYSLGTKSEFLEAFKKNPDEALVNRGYLKSYLDAKDENGDTLLHIEARFSDSIDIIQLILSHGIDINVTNNKGDTPLHLSHRSDNDKDDDNYIKFLQFLLDSKANVNVKNSNGATPLHNLTNAKAVKLLIKYGANVNAKDNEGKTPLEYIAPRNFTGIVSILLEHGAKIDEMPLYPVARHSNNGIILNLLLNNGAKPNTPDKNGNTALHGACHFSDLSIVKLLIDNGADVNAKNAEGDTPLHIVLCTRNSPEVETARLLIGSGANVNIANNSGNTPLHGAVAAFSGFRAVELLIQSGAKVNVKNVKKETPLSLAFAKKQNYRGSGGNEYQNAIEIIQLLQQHPENKYSFWQKSALIGGTIAIGAVGAAVIISNSNNLPECKIS